MTTEHHVYVHLGDAGHSPMQTLRVRSKTMLRKIYAEARRDKWPVRIHVSPDGYGGKFVALTEALRHLPGKGRR